MMSSMMWARLVLSPATLHSVSSVVLCCRVTWHYSHTIAACLDALQALNALPAGTIRRLGNLRACVGNMHA
jgi:hypothetical protein